VSLAKRAPNFPQFPDKFYGLSIRNETYIGQELSTHEIIFDLEDRKVYTSIVAPSGSFAETGEYWIVFSPEGADSGTPQANTYVMFKSLTSAANKSYCSYTTMPDWPTGTFQPPGKFPPQWINSNYKVDLSNWFAFPSDMTYAGSSVWRGVPVDVWNSDSACSLFGHPPVPCTQLATKKGTNIPAATSYSHQKKPNSFESDWISFDWWSEFDTVDVPDIDLPETSWTTKCYNNENGLKVNPERAFVSTTFGMDNFTLQLTSRPINGLGSIAIKFVPVKPNPTVSFLLEDGRIADGLSFDSSSWNVPVRIFLKYLSEGETYFTIVATGGGYDIPHISSTRQSNPAIDTRSYSLRALTCANGIPGWGCP